MTCPLGFIRPCSGYPVVYLRMRPDSLSLDVVSYNSLLEMLGYTPKELMDLGPQWLERLTPDDSTIVYRRLQDSAAIAKGERLQAYFTAIAKDESKHLLHIVVQGVEWQEDKCLWLEAWMWQLGTHSYNSEELLISNAIAAGEFLLSYQPIVRLANKEIAGYESLARWKKNGMLLLPSSFLGKILGSHVEAEFVNAQMRLLVESQTDLHDDQFFSFNLSLFALRDRRIIENVASTLCDIHRKVKLEVSEECLIDEVVRGHLKDLKSAGGEIWLDDVGVGYSAFGELIKADVDGFKVDRSIVENCHADELRGMMLDTLTGIADHNSERYGRKIEIVAEGVSQPEEEDFLRRHHYEYAQGWLYSQGSVLISKSRHIIEAV